jgi:hypothetical protein
MKSNNRDDDVGGIEISHASMDHDSEIKRHKLNHDSMMYHLRCNSKKKYGNGSDDDNDDDDDSDDSADSDSNDKRTNKKLKGDLIETSESSSDAANDNIVYGHDWYANNNNNNYDLSWLPPKESISEQLKGLN